MSTHISSSAGLHHTAVECCRTARSRLKFCTILKMQKDSQHHSEPACSKFWDPGAC